MKRGTFGIPHGAHRGESSENGCASVYTRANTLVAHLELRRGHGGLLGAASGGAWMSFHGASSCASTRRLHGGEAKRASGGAILARVSVWHMHGHEGGACSVLGHLLAVMRRTATSVRCPESARCNELASLPRWHRRRTAARRHLGRPLGGLRCRHGGALAAVCALAAPAALLLHISTCTCSPCPGTGTAAPLLVLVALCHAPY